jgi:dienelactone hydrolase
MTTNHTPASRGPTFRALLVAGLYAGGMLALVLLSPEFLSKELATRAIGVLSGAFIVYYANAVPKALTPLARMRDPAAEQAARRFIGWTIVLGGVGYALAWVIAPMEHASLVSMTLLGTSLLLVIARVVRCRLRRGGLTNRVVAGLLCMSALGGAAPVEAQSRAAGDWHGALTTPGGRLMLVFRIQVAPDGSYTGDLESVNQNPGQRIPLANLTASGDKFAFTIPAIGARYEGEWNDADQAWSGTFRQGASLPLLLRRGLPPVLPVVEGMDGIWRGSLQRTSATLRLVLHVRTTPGGTLVRLDSPDAGAMGLEVERFDRTGDSVRFHVPAAQVEYTGTLRDGRRALAGRWSREGQPEAEVVFARDTAPPAARVRTQWPITPSGYRAEVVSFPNPVSAEVTLAGTLTIPEGKGPFPAAVLISGSGAQDRDETIFGHKPFAVLADHLSRRGIAVLRYDDRGFAASTGDHGSATSADFATDANAAVRYLLGRTDLDPKAVGLVGHSEGGVIGPLAAVENDRVAFVVMLAGPGTSTEQVSLSQRRTMGPSQGVSNEQLERSEPIVRDILRAVRTTPDSQEALNKVRTLLTGEALRKLGATEGQRDLIASGYVGPWMRYFLRYEPAAVLSRIRVPVLAIGGSLDQQVPSDENLPAIRTALSGNPDATVKELPGLNHFFQTAVTGALGEYDQIPETFAPGAMDLIAEWILARSGKAGSVRAKP